MTKKDLTIITILSIIIGFMFLAGFPMGMFDINYGDIPQGCIPTLLNMLLCIFIVFITLKIFKVEFKLGVKKEGLKKGLKESLIVSLITIIVYVITNIITFNLFGNTPSAVRFIVEVLIFYLLAGVMEELLLRGLVLNTFEGFFKKSKHKTMIAIFISTILFSLGHIIAVIPLGIGMILFKAFYPLATGLYWAYLYKKYDNLLVPTIWHSLLDMCAGVVIVFSPAIDRMNTPSMIFLSSMSVVLLVYSIVKIIKFDKEIQ